MNHVVLVEDAPGLRHEFSTYTNSDYHSVVGLAATTRLRYLLFAGASGRYIDDAAMGAILSSYLQILPAGRISTPVTRGVVPAGGRASVPVIFDGVAIGDYDLAVDLEIGSNDPDETVVRIPATLHVTSAQNMFWYYGQRILAAARFVRERKNLFLLYLTNFSCGPDSFLLTYVDEIMGSKPSLTLELDEHGADTGYGTRLEAFADLMAEYEEAPQEKNLLYVKNAPGDLHDKRVLLVPMHTGVVPMFAAAFEKHGYETLMLPEITPEQFELGRKHTRGSECLPAHITTGSMLHALEAYNLRPDQVALFMPTSDGPCRFGQYTDRRSLLSAV